MNALLLTMLCVKKGYELPVFCTFNRAVGLNYQTDKQGNKKQGRMAKALVYGRYIELAEEPVWQGV